MKASFGLRWLEINKKDQFIEKQKFFTTKMARDKFINKLVDKNNFHSILGYLN